MMIAAHPPVHQPWGQYNDDHQLNRSMEEEELQDICDHVQRHSSHMVLPPKQVPQQPVAVPQQPVEVQSAKVETPTPQPEATRDDDDENSDSLAEDQARLCAIKREAISLLSAAHKSTSGASRIQAMTLLAALYKAETKQDLVALGGKVQELLQEKKRQDEELERIRAEEEANKTPERFSRIRASMSRMVHSDNRSVASAPTPRRSEKGWRFFWQRDANTARRSSQESGIHGLQVRADRNSRLQSLSEQQKIWDTRTL